MKITKKGIQAFETAAATLTGGQYVIPGNQISKKHKEAGDKAMSRFIRQNKAASAKKKS